MDEFKEIKKKISNEYVISVDLDWLIEHVEKVERYEKALQKIVEMESPFYHRENQLETPYNYAKVALEQKWLYKGAWIMIRIILKSGSNIDVDSNAQLETIKKIILENNEFVSIGDSFIRIDDISAVLVKEYISLQGN